VCKKSLRSDQAHVEKKSWLAECGSNDGRWVPKSNLSQRNTEAYPEIPPFHLRFGCGSHLDRYSFNFLECGGEIWHGKPSRRKWMLYKYNYDNYEARKENFKVEKIIFVSFHAEGVGTQRQSTVEGRFFSSPMRVAAPNTAFNFPGQATKFRVAWGCRRIPIFDSSPESWGSGGQSGGPFSEL
jgi:hypothetical protein